MHNPTKKALDHAVELAMEGYGLKQIMATTGLSHSQVELAGMGFLYYCAAGAQAIELTPEACAALRFFYGISWGRISVMGGTKANGLPLVPESRVRKLASEFSGTDHVGNRIGRGGRWFAGEQALYEGNLKETGTLIPVGQRAQATQVAKVQSLVKLGSKELKAMCKEAGLATNGTPAQLAKRLAEA